ncbi:MAG: ParA family protein [Chloroflexi bacterium]|nr:ParA family protein [Chloroflexota bacterium]
MARILAFFNQKGGTAKTTSTLNVGAALAERGRSVLVVDLDPQASLTMALGVNVAAVQGSTYDLLTDEDRPLADLTVPTPVFGLSLVPSHPDLAVAELELINMLERERQLAHKLSGALPYDYVLLDSPPSLNILSINILVAARELVIPIEPHPLALLVLPRLFDTLRKVRRLNQDLQVMGFLPTKVQRQARLTQDMLATLEQRYPACPLLPAVPWSVKGAEAVVERNSILHYSSRSPVAAAYREVAAALEQQESVP